VGHVVVARFKPAPLKPASTLWVGTVIREVASTFCEPTTSPITTPLGVSRFGFIRLGEAATQIQLYCAIVPAPAGKIPRSGSGTSIPELLSGFFEQSVLCRKFYWMNEL
jgi:hypothetical protein